MDEDLVQFLLARLKEDEQIARATHPVFLDWEYDDFVQEIRDLGNGNEIASVLPRYGAHIARHDPAHVLADIDAKRKIIIRYAENEDEPWPAFPLYYLAQAYADHPDYQAAWRL